MYAMLVGKLPFRSPRQGTKRRQKLLEQISAGLSEAHEAEMGHVSRNAKDLIHRLLQPDPQRRIKLLDVMVHPWVTKDGSQSLEPYKYIPPDERTRMQVQEMGPSSHIEAALLHNSVSVLYPEGPPGGGGYEDKCVCVKGRC